MDSNDDHASFSSPQEPSSPIHRKKLKRLKKGVRVSNLLNTQRSDLTPYFDGLRPCSDADKDFSEILEEPFDSIRPGLESEGFDERTDESTGADDSVADRDDQVESRDGFDVDEEESHLGVSEGEEFVGKDDGFLDLKAKKSAKKRLCLDVSEEEEKKKRRKSIGVSEKSVDLEDADWDTAEERSHLGDFDAHIDGKEDDSISRSGNESGDGKSTKKKGRKSGGEEGSKRKKRSKNVDGKSEPSARTKKRLEKERKIHLEKLHAETQRLLRETRDAAFEPVRPLCKPISSVIEKIRRRKSELLKEAGIISNNVEASHPPREVSIDLHSEQISISDDGFERKQDAVENGQVVFENEWNNDLDANTVDNCGKPSSLLSQHENLVSDMDLDESKGAFRTPINDTQDLFCGSQESDNDDLQLSSPTDSPSEEALAPSLLAMNLKLDSAPPDDVSSDEEDNDKENLEPQSRKMVDGDPYPNGDLVKAFVDDEAEEEDDSDNDLMRFPENEEYEEQDDNEELKDLTVIGCREKPIDNEMRDQLHQKWLEQQDAGAMDNVLQRLKCGWKQKEPASLEEEEDGEFDDKSGDESADDLPPRNVVCINSTKKLKEMIPQMFTEKDDGFLSSDDEETEQRLVKQRLLEKVMSSCWNLLALDMLKHLVTGPCHLQKDQSTSFLSPADDESSREIFGMIKKVNVAPDIKKKAKSSSFVDMLITGGNSNCSSKSSFLGWASSNSLKSSQKNGSSTFRSFIFGRDDSNSRGGITTSEASSDMVENVIRPTKTPTAKFSYSRTKISSQDTKTTNTSSSHSLLQILKRSSRQSDCTDTVNQTQAVLFAAFKSKTKSMKVAAKT